MLASLSLYKDIQHKIGKRYTLTTSRIYWLWELSCTLLSLLYVLYPLTVLLLVQIEFLTYFLLQEFEYYSISVRDNAILDDLSIYFPICQKFIEAGRKKGGVLVHWYVSSPPLTFHRITPPFWHIFFFRLFPLSSEFLFIVNQCRGIIEKCQLRHGVPDVEGEPVV